MYCGCVLLHFALCIASVQAFFPYTPNYLETDATNKRTAETGGLKSDTKQNKGFISFKLLPGTQSEDEPLLNKISRVARGLAKKYGSELPSRTIPGHVFHAKRDNKYSIVEAQEPTQSNSAGIDQDGTDYSYFIQAELGSKATPMYMLIDTGASTTWVMGEGCTSDVCEIHNMFGPEDSDTLVDTGKSFSVQYGSGSVSGHRVTDSVKIAGLEVTLTFGLANVTSSQFSQFPFDGILGLSMSTSEQTFLQQLKNANAITSNIFAVSLARGSDGVNDGEISFGATNPVKYTGDISYTTLEDTSGSSWAIPLDDVTVGGKSAGIVNKRAYIDTGTTYAFAPSADVETMYKMVPDSSSSDGGITWTMPCDADAQVAFRFSGKTWTISSKDLLSPPGNDGRCTGNIFGMEVVKGSWLLGDMFLKNVYTVFDVDKARIGFAAKPAVTATSTKSSSPTGTSTPNSSGGTSMATATAAAGPGSGLSGHETPTGSLATAVTGSPDASSSASTSPGERVHAGSAYISMLCMLSTLAAVI